MAGRIALGAFAALRAVLVYGEGPDLCSRPVRVPRLRRRSPVGAPAGPGEVRASLARAR